LQLLINSTIAFSEYCIIAISFLIVFQVNKFINFSFAIVFTSGAYFTFLFSQLFGLPLYTSIPLAILCTCLLGCLIELIIYKHLRKRKSSLLILLLASLGIYIVLQNVISMVFGDDTKSIRNLQVVEGINIFGARITPVQIIIIGTSILLVLLTGLYLRHSKTGRAMRAVSNGPDLANISGINSNKVTRVFTSYH